MYDVITYVRNFNNIHDRVQKSSECCLLYVPPRDRPFTNICSILFAKSSFNTYSRQNAMTINIFVGNVAIIRTDSTKQHPYIPNRRIPVPIVLKGILHAAIALSRLQATLPSICIDQFSSIQCDLGVVSTVAYDAFAITTLPNLTSEVCTTFPENKEQSNALSALIQM